MTEIVIDRTNKSEKELIRISKFMSYVLRHGLTERNTNS